MKRKLAIAMCPLGHQQQLNMELNRSPALESILIQSLIHNRLTIKLLCRFEYQLRGGWFYAIHLSRVFILLQLYCPFTSHIPLSQHPFSMSLDSKLSLLQSLLLQFFVWPGQLFLRMSNLKTNLSEMRNKNQICDPFVYFLILTIAARR
jgi:hypothetical protein